MCGRITRTRKLAEVAERFQARITVRDFPPGYNIAPSQLVPVVVSEGGSRALAPMRWGLVPSWAKDPGAFGAKCINAKAETLLERSAFKKPFQSRRVLVPADGFYEWRRPDRQPFWITLKDRGLFAFAGLWDSRRSAEGHELRTFTVITVAANDAIRPVHERMPAILRPQDESRWLGAEPAEAVKGLLAPYPAGELSLTPVSTLVNSPKSDSSECLRPIVEQPSLFPAE